MADSAASPRDLSRIRRLSARLFASLLKEKINPTRFIFFSLKKKERINPLILSFLDR